ncbi:MAG: 3-keto-5-aminohexanoate cleavage protein [Anaerolineae bacterium]|nr:MAG: 3-keto-5-aminohexanoate cleavage protein [Anaerolineae bacterium]
MEDKLVVTVAPCIPPYMTAGIPGLDLSPEGIADEVVRAYDAGANVVHLHVWDERGQPTTDPSAFERTIRLIRKRCDIVLEGSTGGVNELSPAERSVALQAEVEMASLNPGSVNYDQGVYVNSPDDIAYWAQEMHRRRIKPDIAIFEVGMIANSLDLVDRGWIEEPLLFSFALGQKGAMPASARNLLFLSETIPRGSLWGVAGHGGHDLWLSTLAMVMGGHARAGYEDNPYYRPGELAKSNAQLIERLVRLAREIGRQVATPSEARQMLGLAHLR